MRGGSRRGHVGERVVELAAAQDFAWGDFDRTRDTTPSLSLLSLPLSQSPHDPHLSMILEQKQGWFVFCGPLFLFPYLGLDIQRLHGAARLGYGSPIDIKHGHSRIRIALRIVGRREGFGAMKCDSKRASFASVVPRTGRARP